VVIEIELGVFIKTKGRRWSLRNLTIVIYKSSQNIIAIPNLFALRNDRNLVLFISKISRNYMVIGYDYHGPSIE
jgi:hypothetical protein